MNHDVSGHGFSPAAGAWRERIRLLVFDLDGTLVDSSLDLTAAVNATLANLGRPPLPLTTVRNFIGDGARLLVRRSLGLEPEAAAALRGGGVEAAPESAVEPSLDFLLHYYAAHLLDQTTVFPGVSEAIERLFRGFPLAVLTNKPEAPSRAILAGLHLDRYFGQVVGGDTLPTRKPDPAGVVLLASTLGVSPDRILVVGDSGIDVHTARAAGAMACGVRYGFAVEGLLKAAPDLIVDDLRDLAAMLIG